MPSNTVFAMMEDTILELDDLFTDLVCSSGDDVIKSAMQLVMFLMDGEHYDNLKSIDDGGLIKIYLIGIIGMLNDFPLIGKEIPLKDLSFYFPVTDEVVFTFACQ